MVVLPFVFLVWLTAITWHLCQDWRGAVLVAATIWALVLVVITEALSPACLITPTMLALAWGTALAALVIGSMALLRRHRSRSATANQHPHPHSKAQPGPLAWVWCAWIALIIVTIGVVAWFAPPNTWDSMTYHMARVAHWRQNQSVAHYPTNILRQLWASPAAEYGVLHLQVLTGGDRLANFVQWMAMVGSVIGASLLARELGAQARGQILAAVLVVTLPMGILQASGTQTDYVAAFFMLCTVYFLLPLMPATCWSTGRTDQAAEPGAIQPSAPGWKEITLAGTALGLAGLAKATNGFVALPILVWVAWTACRAAPASGVRRLALVGAVALAINLPFLVRNQSLFGRPLGPVMAEYRNARFGVGTTVSNLVRFTASHLNSPSPGLSRWMTDKISAGLAAVGIDANDPATMFHGERFLIASNPQHEDLAGNPLQLLVELAAAGALLLVPRLRRLRGARGLALALGAGILIFCGYLRWHPWGNRWETSFFVLAAAFAAPAIESLGLRFLPHLLAGLLLLAATPWVLANQCRPIIGPGHANIFTIPREVQYFAGAPDMSLYAMLSHARQVVRQRGIQTVGVVMSENDGEYLLWALFQSDGGPPVRIVHVNVSNASASLYRLRMFRYDQPQITLKFKPEVGG